MSRPPPPAAPAALDEADLQRLESLLDRVPAPLEPLDAPMLDGFLCGALLQPRAVAQADWMKHVCDVDGRPLPPGWASREALEALVLRRYRELQGAIEARRWFDPWVFEMDEAASPLDTVLPWVAGFAAAMELFPGLMRLEDPQVLESLAVLYSAFDPEDLEEADALIAEIETLEPPATLPEAVEDIVTSVLRLADVSRPRPDASRGARASKAPARRRPGPH